jgi:hypothetical protein
VNALFLLLNLSLLGYLYVKLVPENNANNRILLNSKPDLGILTILITMISVAWIALSVLWLIIGCSRLPAKPASSIEIVRISSSNL